MSVSESSLSSEQITQLLSESEKRVPIPEKRRNQFTKKEAAVGMKICCRCERATLKAG